MPVTGLLRGALSALAREGEAAAPTIGTDFPVHDDARFLQTLRRARGKVQFGKLRLRGQLTTDVSGMRHGSFLRLWRCVRLACRFSRYRDIAIATLSTFFIVLLILH